MESSQSIERRIQTKVNSSSEEFINNSVSIEAEIPEALYLGMKDFLINNPQSSKYRMMSSALATFLFQNGCNDRSITEIYLNDLFNLSDS